MKVCNAEHEKSEITTLGVIPKSADNMDSLKTILANLHDLYGIGTQPG